MAPDSFFYAVLTGVILGVLYDVTRFFRIVLRKSFFPDFIFWVISAFICYIFFLAFENGNIRILLFLVIFIGFLIYIYSLGIITQRLEKWLCKLLLKMRITLKLKAKKIKKLLQSLYNILYNKANNSKRSLKRKHKGDKNEKQSKKEIFS